MPAFQFMWSAHDVFLEHRRRYTLNRLEEVVRRAGLRPVVGCYYYGLTLPLAAAARLLQRDRDLKPRSDLRVHSPRSTPRFGRYVGWNYHFSNTTAWRD
ncbi:MAG: hypothetical protein WDN04_19050 [Rhodospirillales bacterium]